MNMKLPELHFGFGRKVPVILQSEGAECGLACLAMVAGYYGHHIDLPSLRSQISLSLRGMTFKDLIDASSALKFSSRAIKVNINDIRYVQMPCILHWSFNHFVVLKKITFKSNGSVRSYLINNPGRGEVTVSPEDFEENFTGAVLELTPAPDFETKKEVKRINLFSLMRSAVGLKRGILQIFLLALALEIFTVISPFFMQLVVDGAIFSSDRDMLLALVFGFGLLMLIQQAIVAFRAWAVLYMSTHLNLQWVSNVFRHLLYLPSNFFEKRNLSDILSRFGAVHSIEQALSTKLVEAVLDGIFSISIFLMLLFYSVTLTLIVLGFLIVYLLVRWASYATFKRANEQHLVLQARENSIFMESISGVQAIKLFNEENNSCSRWINALVASINRKVATKKMQVGFTTLEQVLKGLENLIVIWIGALLVIDHKFSLGMLFAYITYKTMLVGRMYSFNESVFELKMLSLQSERLADIILAKREDDSVDDVTHKAHQYGSSLKTLDDFTIEIKNISFRYSDVEPWVIRNLSLIINPGESIAITGASGSGKTTLLKLLMGMLEPVEGEILVGGVPLTQFGYRNFRNIISAVMQDDHFFSGSIADNISFFDQTVDVVRLQECAESAAIANDIKAMPMGYQTLIIGANAGISGGQKQRILLARALYKRPKILFLDEATSHLDVANESHVNASIQKLSLTRIIVAHRQETICTAERVVKLEDGAIISDTKIAAIYQ
ncbi:MAG: peptidase domain-containing ABC transporter [Pseudomonadota bacterium]